MNQKRKTMLGRSRMLRRSNPAKARVSASHVEIADTPPPVNDGAKVKTELYTRSIPNLLAYAQNHEASMNGNAYYPAPMPSTSAFHHKVEKVAARLAAYEAAKVAVRVTRRSLESARDELLQGFQVRASYVQTASNGNAVAISTSGLDLRHARTPTTSMPQPQNLRVVLNGTQGAMQVSWNRVPKAICYLLEIAEDIPGAERIWKSHTPSRSKLDLRDLPLGRTFVFRVAAIGPSNTRSPWSPEATRIAS